MACTRRRDPGTEPLQEWTWQQWAEAATALDLKVITANDFRKAKSAKGLLKPQDLQRFTKARGVAIEANLDKGRGAVATMLVERGTLRIGDAIVVGSITYEYRCSD